MSPTTRAVLLDVSLQARKIRGLKSAKQMAAPVSSALYHVTRPEFAELLAHQIIFHNVLLTGLKHIFHENKNCS
jgi:hypothetical protein